MTDPDPSYVNKRAGVQPLPLALIPILFSRRLLPSDRDPEYNDEDAAENYEREERLRFDGCLD